MTYLIAGIIAGEIVLYLVMMPHRDGLHPRAAVGWFYQALCLGLFATAFASLCAYLDTFHKLQNLDIAGQRYLAVRDLVGTLRDMESGHRGFLLTGRASYAEPYQAGLKALPTRTRRLHDLYRDNDGDQARAEGILKLVDIRAHAMAESYRLREQHRPEEALVALESDRGKSTMDLIRIAADELAREALRRYDFVKLQIKTLAEARIFMAAAVMVGAVVQMALVAIGSQPVVTPPRSNVTS
jgi:CHASE3 domain sensor protein